MARGEERLCDAEGLDGLLGDLARRIAEGLRPGVPLRLVGVRTRGVPIAERLATQLGRILGEPIAVGAVDITLYRDDLGGGSRWPVLLGTDITFEVDGAGIVLVDDVLFTGRTIRAALNAVCDLGRPASVRLAVVVDRGGRELPIRADLAGLMVEARPEESVRVRVRPVDAVDEVVRIGPDPRGDDRP